MFPDTLSFMAATVHGDKIWCSNLNFNGLFTVDVVDGRACYIGRFAGYSDDSVGLHRSAEVYKDKIIFFPNYSTSIDSYNFDGTFCNCKIASWEAAKTQNNFTCIAGAFLWRDMYYIFPRFPKMNMIKFSPDENRICEEIELKLANELNENEDGNLAFNCVCVGKYVYIPIFETNYVVKYDLETDSEYKMILPETSSITGSMGFDGDSFWLEADGEIKRYDGSLTKIISSYSCISKNEGIITRFIFKNDFVFALPAYLGTVKVIDTKHNNIQEIKIDTSVIKLEIGPISRWRHTESSICFEKEFTINPVGINSILRIDYRTFKITEKMFKASPESIPKKNFNKVNYEQGKGDLEEFICFFVNDKETP